MANPVIPKHPGVLRAYLRQSAEPLPAAALTLPLLLLYGLGIVVLPEAANGADIVSHALVAILGSLGNMRWAGYLGFYGLLLLGNLLLILHLRKTSHFSPRWFWGVLGESAVYAVVVGTLSSSITTDITQLLHALVPLSVTSNAGPLTGIVMSAGAGLHEELLFRLGGVAGVGRMLLGPNWRAPSVQLLVVLLGSSVVFSLAHHVVEPFAFTPFVFRTVAGLLFGSLFLLRGFAVAAWTHCLYDVWVIVVLGR